MAGAESSRSRRRVRLQRPWIFCAQNIDVGLIDLACTRFAASPRRRWGSSSPSCSCPYQRRYRRGEEDLAAVGLLHAQGDALPEQDLGDDLLPVEKPMTGDGARSLNARVGPPARSRAPAHNDDNKEDKLLLLLVEARRWPPLVLQEAVSTPTTTHKANSYSTWLVATTTCHGAAVSTASSWGCGEDDDDIERAMWPTTTSTWGCGDDDINTGPRQQR